VDVDVAEAMAIELMREHNLNGWTFKYDNAKRRFGMCDFGKRVISLSFTLTVLNGESEVRDTILHEIAHALAGPAHNHDWHWRRTAMSIGCTGDRCYSSDDVKTPTGRFIGTCPVCGYQTRPRHRRRRVACGQCCGGVFNAAYLLVWAERR
jgi:predicted SprT family Zn-dependent metalloprotease